MSRSVSQLSFIGEEQIIKLKTPRKKRPVSPDRVLVARILHLGAGRQSSWLAEAIVIGELPKIDLAVFADTGDEPEWVYDQVDYLRGRLASVGIPLSVVRRSPGGLVRDITDNEMQRFASLPLFTILDTGKVGRLKRQCTSEYKIEPTDSYILQWLIERDYARIVSYSDGRLARRVKAGLYTENWYGISYEEFYRAGNRGPSWQQAVYPLIERRMTAMDCVRSLKVHNLPIPKKSACRVCPFHDDDYWFWLKVNSPADFEHACSFDDWLRSPQAKSRPQLRGLRFDVYLHRLCQPLRTIDFARLVEEKQRTGFIEEADLCGDFCMT